MEIEVQILKAFVDNNAGGNPAGVVLEANCLTKEQKQEVAKKVGLSETAFVSNSDIADFKLDFFTPNRQIAHCGHATIATFSYLSQLGKIDGNHSSKETIDGRREILIEGELAFMEQKAPIYIDPKFKTEEILKSLSITSDDLIPEASILIVNTGNSFAIIPAKNEEVLKKLIPDFRKIEEISEEFDLVGYYVFSPSKNAERDVETRMFAPRYGIEEESGTGMAAGPLASYLFDILNYKKNEFYIQQGKYMGAPSPSLIIVNLSVENGKIKNLMAGGKGISVESRKIII